MKKIIVILFIGIILMLTGCMGEDGQNGDAYLRINLDYGVYAYWDNNPGIPYGFTEGHYYQCSPGTYSYDYEDDYAYYYGTYTLTIEYGEDGEMFWVNGADGEDSYFTLTCHSDYYRGEQGEKVNREITKQESDVITGEIVNTIHQEFRSGIYKLEINLNVVEK